MRTRNSIRNSLYNVISQIAILLIGFVIPRFIIGTYGSEVNGLSSNISQILNILNLLQAGVVGASIFEMYEPISKNDYKTIGSIFYSARHHFRKLSLIFWILSFTAIPYIVFFTSTELKTVDVVHSVIVLGFNATVIFRYYCCYDVIFSAYQQKYLLVVSNVISKIVYYILLFAIIKFRLHYVLMYCAALVGSVTQILYLKYKYNCLYKNYLVNYKNETHYVVKNQWHLFGNQIIQNIIEAAPPLVVSATWGLKYASVLSIYLMIVNVFKMVMSSLQNAVAASFGDLIARKNESHVKEVFDTIQFIFSFISIPLFGTCAAMIAPFVKLYCTGITDMTYVYVGLGMCMTMYVCTYTQFLSFNLYINSRGLYGDVLKANVIFGVVSLLLMIAFSVWNFQYVCIGNIAFYMSAVIHRFLYLRRKNYQFNYKNMVRAVVPIVIVMVMTTLSRFYHNIIGNWLRWCLMAGITCLILICVALFYALVIDRVALKQSIKLFLGFKEGKKK